MSGGCTRCSREHGLLVGRELADLRHQLEHRDLARLEHAAVGTLGAEEANETYEAPGDTRTFLERNDWVVQALLVTAALVAAAAGLLALRRRTS